MRAACDSLSTIDVGTAIKFAGSSDVFSPIDVGDAFDAASDLISGTGSITDTLSHIVSVSDILNPSTSSDVLNTSIDLSSGTDRTSDLFSQIVNINDFLNPAVGVVDTIDDATSRTADVSDVFGDADSINCLFQNLREYYYRSLNRTNNIDELLNVNNSNAPISDSVGSSMFSDLIVNSALLHHDNISDTSNQANNISQSVNSIVNINNILNPSSNITHSNSTLNSNNSFSNSTANNSLVRQSTINSHIHNSNLFNPINPTANTDNHLSNSFVNNFPVNRNANTATTLPVYTTRPTSFQNTFISVNTCTSDSFQRTACTTSNLVSNPFINLLASLRVNTNVSSPESSTLSSTYATNTRLSNSSYYSQNNSESLLGVHSTGTNVTSRDSFSSISSTSRGTEGGLNLNTSDSLNRTLVSPPSGTRNLYNCRANATSLRGTGDSVVASSNAVLTSSEVFLNSLARAAVSPSGGPDLRYSEIPTSTRSSTVSGDASQPINVSASDSLVLKNSRNSNVRHTTPEYNYNSSWTMPTTTISSRNIPAPSHSVPKGLLLGRNSTSGISTVTNSSKYSNLGLLTYPSDSSSRLSSSRRDLWLGPSTSSNYTKANTEPRESVIATTTSPNELFLSTYIFPRNCAIRHTSPQGYTSSVQSSHSDNRESITISNTTPGWRAFSGTNFESPPRSEFRPVGNRQCSSCLDYLSCPPGFHSTHVSQLRRASERRSAYRFDSFSSDYSSHRSDPPSFNYGRNTGVDSITPRSDDGFASGGSQFNSPSYYTELPRSFMDAPVKQCKSEKEQQSKRPTNRSFGTITTVTTTLTTNCPSVNLSAFNPLSDYTLEEFVYDIKEKRMREQTRPIIQRHESDLSSPTHFLPADLFHESPLTVSDVNSNTKIQIEDSGKASESKYKDRDTSDTSTSCVIAERSKNEIHYDEFPIRLVDDIPDCDRLESVMLNSSDRSSNEGVLNIASKNNSTGSIHVGQLRLNMASQEIMTHEIPPNPCPNTIIQTQETPQPTQFSNSNTLFDWTQYEIFCHEFKMNFSDTNESRHHKLAEPQPILDGRSNDVIQDPVSKLSSKVEADEKLNNLLPYWASPEISLKTESKYGAAENIKKHNKKQRPLFVTAISDILPKQTDAPATDAEATELTFNDKDAFRQNNKRREYKQVLEKLEPYLSRQKEQESKQVASKNKRLTKMEDSYSYKTPEKLVTQSTDGNWRKNEHNVRHKVSGRKSTVSKAPIYEVLELNLERVKATDTPPNEACEEPSSNDVALFENDYIDNQAIESDQVSNDGREINVENSSQEVNIEESLQEINNECSKVVSIEISTKKESIECSMPEVSEDIQIESETQVEITSDKSGKDTKIDVKSLKKGEVKKAMKAESQQKRRPKNNRGSRNTKKKRKA